ncbi:SRPBCC domain-containing protein [Amycolatopsis magusensis]|uniref:SRPBCC domain-containing protein n=1 Tax=Amycolatopsis magusensis TaxID=882444 RepID=UPI0024A908B3|nr:SRPBCC domain-containing protein [Amycolatopsis magusensis]MDI5980379.1 SRPBCC domain-containing protein [Amycolatopsis magusensis]
MRLDHRFTVPAPLDQVWQAVVDPERVAPCMPGATLTEVDGDAFSGTVKVKLGPISLTYKGKGEFLEKDAGARKVVIKASGKDARGSGTAAATVTVTLHEEDGATVGEVATDLKVTGRPAQFGRGMIAEVSGKILDTFATCLAGELGDAPASPQAGEAGTAKLKSVKSETTGSPSEGSRKGTLEAAVSETAESRATKPEVEATDPGATKRDAAKSKTGEAPSTRTEATTRQATKRQAAASQAPETEAVQAGAATTPQAVVAGEVETERPKLRAVDPPPEPEAEPINLLDYAGAPVAKRVAPVVVLAAVVAGVVFVIRALRR